MNLTIITYHYVRPLANSRYRNLKALDYDLFKKQIEFITKNYTVIAMETALRMINDNLILQSAKPFALLAFDDGYIDHYTYVFPILQQYSIQGSFFIPVKPILENTVLDVNKIHYLLERDCIKDLIATIHQFINKNCTDSFQDYYDKYTEENRFDDKDTMFVKRLLQKWDNIDLRKKLIDKLFDEYFGCGRSVTEAQLSQELYMNPDQIRHMHRAGMYIGGHTYNHYHLGAQTLEEQYDELVSSMVFLSNIGCDPKYTTLSYPYGSHNETTKILLKEAGFKLGIGIDYGIADLKTMDCFNVPRIDCNDITKMMNGN